jgi:hypothetical protein
MLDLSIVNHNEVVLLEVLPLDKGISRLLDSIDVLFNFSGVSCLFKNSNGSSLGSSIEQITKSRLLFDSLLKKVESGDNLRFTLNDVIVQSKDHLILHNIVKESEGNELVSIIVLSYLIEDLAEASPPTTEEFS